MSDKRTIELLMELDVHTPNAADSAKLTKTVEANFVPQHGMVVMIDEIPFRVKTVALAGLSGLKHVAFPITTKGIKFASKNKDSDKGREWFQSRVQHFQKLGWSQQN